MDLLKTVLHGLNVGVTFLIVITVLIAVHEYGHYLFAKLCGMHVEAFAVMVGGIRKTPLEQHLKRPLARPFIVWTIGTAVAILTFLAGFFDFKPLFFAGLSFLTLIGPVWIISRLCALYHRPLTAGLLTLAKSWGVVAIILFFGTQFRNLDPGYALSMFLAGSSCAVLIAYYFPVLNTTDPEGNKGNGNIFVDQHPTHVQFKPILSKTNKEGTEFSLLLLPLGGFAAIKGMQPKEDGSETKVDKGFFSRPPLQRLLVLFAGPLFSVLFGVIVLFGTYMVQGQADKQNTTIAYLSTGAAKAAGLKVGDKITAVNDEKVSTFYDVLTRIRYSYNDKFEPIPVKIDVQREQESKTFTFLPIVTDEPQPVANQEGEQATENVDGKELPILKRQAKLGFIAGYNYKPIAAKDAFVAAVLTPVGLTLGLVEMVIKPSTAKDNVGGPGAIVEQTSNSINQGFTQVLRLAGMLSISLGVMNLLPIPPLDGGQMVIAFAELLRRNKRLPMNFQLVLQNVGGLLVVVLMLAVFAVDAGRRSELNKIKEETSVRSTQSSKPTK
ncbi:MAG: M50 family metallopeptidase [Fimbriimonadaceae bacterium]